MNDQYQLYLSALLNLHRLMQTNRGDSKMLTPEIHFLIYQEQHRDRLQAMERRRWLQAAGLDQGVSLKLYRGAIGWLGKQMVQWGSQLQNYASIRDKGCQESSLTMMITPKL